MVVTRPIRAGPCAPNGIPASHAVSAWRVLGGLCRSLVSPKPAFTFPVCRVKTLDQTVAKLLLLRTCGFLADSCKPSWSGRALVQIPSRSSSQSCAPTLRIRDHRRSVPGAPGRTLPVAGIPRWGLWALYPLPPFTVPHEDTWTQLPSQPLLAWLPGVRSTAPGLSCLDWSWDCFSSRCRGWAGTLPAGWGGREGMAPGSGVCLSALLLQLFLGCQDGGDSKPQPPPRVASETQRRCGCWGLGTQGGMRWPLPPAFCPSPLLGSVWQSAGLQGPGRFLSMLLARGCFQLWRPWGLLLGPSSGCAVCRGLVDVLRALRVNRSRSQQETGARRVGQTVAGRTELAAEPACPL